VLIKVVSIDPTFTFADIEISASGVPDHAFFGPNACSPLGYVWRAADTLDYACVNGFRRKVVQDDNAASASRKVLGSDDCKAGFVWREAWPGDLVCVSPTEHRRAQEESGESWNLVANDYDSKHIAARPWKAVIP
jgi:hypothetical protein